MARQVADSLHLLQNLASVLTEVFTAHAPQLTRVNAQRAAVPTPVHDPACLAAAPERPSVPVAPQQPSSAAAGWAHQRRTRRWAHDPQVWTYHWWGWTLDAITHQVGISRRTVLQDSPEPDVSRAPAPACP
jgi:hypothetical protein